MTNANLKRVVRDVQPRSAALPEMASAVLILDEDPQIEYANARAKELFMPVDPIGCRLAAMFASCGATSGEEVFAAVDAGAEHAPVLLRLDRIRNRESLRQPANEMLPVSFVPGGSTRRLTNSD